MTKWWFFVKYKVYKIVVKCANTRAKSDSAYKIMALSVFVISTESWPAQVILKTCAPCFFHTFIAFLVFTLHQLANKFIITSVYQLTKVLQFERKASR